MSIFDDFNPFDDILKNFDPDMFKKTSSSQEFADAVKKYEDASFNPTGFHRSIRKKDTSWIYKRKDVILNSKDDNLKSSFGIVCAYDGKLDLAYSSFDSISQFSHQINESKGVIAYEQELYSVAKKHLRRTSRTKFGAISRSLSLIKLGKNNFKLHEKILADVSGDIVNRIVGVLAYNSHDYDVAHLQFTRAWIKNKSDSNLLNLLAAEYNSKRDNSYELFAKKLNSYFLEAKNVPSVGIIDSYISKTSLDLPSFKLGKNLYKALEIINK